MDSVFGRLNGWSRIYRMGFVEYMDQVKKKSVLNTINAVNTTLSKTETMLDTEISDQLRKDAKGAMYAFLLINAFAIAFFFLGYREFASIALGAQLAIILLWLFPVFLNQTLVKKEPMKLALHKALASYRDLMSHVNWN